MGEKGPGRLRFWLAGVVLAATSTFLALGIVEAALRLARFEYHLSPTVQVGWPDPETIRAHYAGDADLFWVTQDYRTKLRAARRSHPNVVFMGDSCTEFGTYPDRTLAVLATEHGLAVSGVPLGVGGWSSEQGVAQLRRDVLPLHPRVIVVYFGWNDHWIAFGPTDSQLRRARRLLWMSDHLRIVQLLMKAWMGSAANKSDRPFRVPPQAYLTNLLEIARLAKDSGVLPVLVTAPSNHVAGREPEYLLHRHVTRLADVIPLHLKYVDLTKQAAREGHAVLCDAAAAFDRLPDRDRLFRSDGIHFTADGDQALADIVGGCIADGMNDTVH